MTRKQAIGAATLASVLLAGCGGGWWPLSGSQPRPIPEVPPGAVAYDCEGGKRLFLRYSNDGKSAWVIFPDREFRLDRIPSGSGEQFSNGPTTLATKGEEALLTENGTLTFANCKRRGN